RSRALPSAAIRAWAARISASAWAARAFSAARPALLDVMIRLRRLRRVNMGPAPGDGPPRWPPDAMKVSEHTLLFKTRMRFPQDFYQGTKRLFHKGNAGGKMSGPE